MPSPVPRSVSDLSSPEERDRLIARLYLEHRRGLARYLASKFPNSAVDAEDLVQATFLKLADQPDFHRIADIRAYLFTLACNVAIDGQRKKVRRRAIEDELHAMAIASPALDISSEKILLDRERLRCIEAAIARMPLLRRRIFLLIRFEGLTVQEVAARFAMTEAAIYKHVARALHDCAIMLEKSDRKATPSA